MVHMYICTYIRERSTKEVRSMYFVHTYVCMYVCTYVCTIKQGNPPISLPLYNVLRTYWVPTKNTFSHFTHFYILTFLYLQLEKGNKNYIFTQINNMEINMKCIALYSCTKLISAE